MSYHKNLKKTKDLESKLLDSRVDKITSEISNKIFRELAKSQSQINKASTPDQIVNALNTQRTAISDKVLEKLFIKYTDQYRDKLGIIKESLERADQDVVYSKQDQEQIKSVMQYDINRIRARIDVYLSDIEAQILSSRLQGAKVNTDSVREVIQPRMTNQLNTEVTTNLDAFERTFTIAQSLKLGMNLFLYVGGLIKTSRDFCIERDGNIYSWKEILTWDNGQGLPASVYLGGYNCRHHLSPISELVAKEEFGYVS